MNISKYIFIWTIAAFGMPFWASCSSDDDEMPNVTPTATGTVKDKDGNEYQWVRIGNLDWTTTNMRCDKPFYEDNNNPKWTNEWGEGISFAGTLEDWKAWFAQYGNYYTWQEAVNNAPEGWRLPTDDDFKALERMLGIKESGLNNVGWRKGASALMTQSNGGTGLNFTYGGEICRLGYSTDLYHQVDYGYYWTATSTEVNKEAAAYARMITPGMNAVNRLVILQHWHFLNARYVRDAK